MVSVASAPLILIIREPRNRHDKKFSVLAVKNCEILGHLEKSVAAGIAELIDSFKSQVL